MGRSWIPMTRKLVLLVMCICIVSVGADMRKNIQDKEENQGGEMVYKDPKKPVESRIVDLLKRMTLEEKIGQMTQIERENATADVMKKYAIGSVLSGGGSTPKPNATAKDWVEMVNKIQHGSLSSRLGIPMIYGIDAVHGHNNVYKATIFPHNVGLGVTRDSELLKRIGEATALEIRATGIPYTFAPCIAVCRDPRWGRCYESYSEDPQIVEQMTSIIDGLQGVAPANSVNGYPFVAGKNKVAGCAKHFVGDGGTVKGINENNTVIDWDGLLKIHMPAYFPAIKKGVATVMASYSSWNGVKMHANHELLTKFLKEKLQFKGFVISDWQGIDRITDPPHKNYTYSVETSVNAGVDMIMVPYNYTEFIGILTDLVKKNAVTMARIDDAVTRILTVKFAMGLFDNPLADKSFENELGSQAHRELAREAVRKSLVLLKNGKDAKQPVLPLPKNAGKILVAGTHADNLAYQCGGWTITWQGGSGNNYTTGTTILKAIEATVDKGTQVVYKENPEKSSLEKDGYSYAIVVVGEVPYAETKGDSLNLTIPKPGQDIIENACENIKCVVVLISGRPVVIEPYLEKMDALVAAWLPGSEGQGIADVLFGDFGFTGKLARTWFKRVDQLPMNIGDKNYDPLFPFGFGLTTEPGKGKASPLPSPPSDSNSESKKGSKNKEEDSKHKEEGSKNKEEGSKDKKKGSENKEEGSKDKKKGSDDKEEGNEDKEEEKDTKKKTTNKEEEEEEEKKEEGSKDKKKGSDDKEEGNENKEEGSKDKKKGSDEKEEGNEDKEEEKDTKKKTTNKEEEEEEEKKEEETKLEKEMEKEDKLLKKEMKEAEENEKKEEKKGNKKAKEGEEEKKEEEEKDEKKSEEEKKEEKGQEE